MIGRELHNGRTTRPHKTTRPRKNRGPVVEAPGIEPGSENFEATSVYVRIRPFISSQLARVGALALRLSTCLISPHSR